MKVTKQDIPVVAAFVAEFWEVQKAFWIPEPNNVDYWNAVWDALGNLKKKYPHPYVSYAVDAFGNYLQFEYEVARRTGGNQQR